MATKIINVSNAVQLAAAVKAAKGGETILLAAGDYGNVNISNKLLGDTVTIKSADSTHDAVFSGLRMNNASGFQIQDVDIHRPLASGETAVQAAYISNVSHVALVGVDFTGSMDGNAANDGTALRITGSNDVSVTGSSFEQWKLAATFTDSTGLNIAGNTVTGVSKIFDLSNLKASTIADNSFVGVKPAWSEASAAGVSVHGNAVTGFDAPVAAVAPQGADHVIHVANAAQLTTALKSVTGGETILLAAGDYGSVNISRKAMTSTVTIKSADSAHDAVITDLRVHSSSNFTFSDIDIHRPLLAGERDFTTAAYVDSSSKIAFAGVDFSGSMDNNAWNDGVGLRLSGTKDVTVVDSTFTQLTNAITLDYDTGVKLVGNTVTQVREGFDFAAVHDVDIERNYFTDFQPNFILKDHSDSIQFWTNGVTQGSSNILIRDNVMLHGATGGVQGIFIGQENTAVRYSDFTIENNLYYGDARHGITLVGVDGAKVENNTLVSAVGGMLETAINVVNTTGVTVDHNITPLYLPSGTNTTLVASDNIDLYDRTKKAGVTLESVFGQGNGSGLDASHYAVKAGSAAALLHAGFTMVDGVGSAAFDLSHPSTYATLDHHLAGLAIFA